jgi:hypothetical protein
MWSSEKSALLSWRWKSPQARLQLSWQTPWRYGCPSSTPCNLHASVWTLFLDCGLCTTSLPPAAVCCCLLCAATCYLLVPLPARCSPPSVGCSPQARHDLDARSAVRELFRFKQWHEARLAAETKRAEEAEFALRLAQQKMQADAKTSERELQALQQSSEASIEHFKKQLMVSQAALDDLQVLWRSLAVCRPLRTCVGSLHHWGGGEGHTAAPPDSPVALCASARPCVRLCWCVVVPAQVRVVMERESANTQAEKQIQGMKDMIEAITEESNGRRIWTGWALVVVVVVCGLVAVNHPAESGTRRRFV